MEQLAEHTEHYKDWLTSLWLFFFLHSHFCLMHLQLNRISYTIKRGKIVGLYVKFWYVCIFVLGRVNISGHWRPKWMVSDDYNDGQMIFGDFGGLKFADICLTGEEKPRKTSPRKPVPTGDRTRARCVAGAHATAWHTAVDVKFWAFSRPSLRTSHKTTWT